MTLPDNKGLGYLNGKIVQRVGNIEYLKDSISKKVTVTSTSQSLATLLGEALPSDVLAVTVGAGANTIRYNPAGAADANNGALPSVYTLYGTKSVLDLAQFWAASSVEMQIQVHVIAEE